MKPQEERVVEIACELKVETNQRTMEVKCYGLTLEQVIEQLKRLQEETGY